MPVEERLVAGGVPERIDVERVLVRDRPHQLEARVLVPSARLIEVRVRDEQQHEQRRARIRHCEFSRPATRTPMLTTSPTTVANAAPFGP